MRILYVTHVPPSPPRFGAQARMHGLMTALARRHEISAISLVDGAVEPARSAMQAYCRDVILVQAGRPGGGAAKRLAQLRSLASLQSFERRSQAVPSLQEAVGRALLAGSFDVVNVESPYFPGLRLRAGRDGAAAPPMVVDEHNVEYDLLRQSSGAEGGGLGRRLYSALNWRKLRREERAVWRRADGITVTSRPDAERLLADVPSARVAVVPNAVDVRSILPRPGDPPVEDGLVVFFGAIHYFPNTDGILHFLRDSWPILSASHPRARLRIVGARPPPQVLGYRGPRVEVTGLVDDVRPHLAAASVIIAPLRLGGGTRLKILEGMAMAKAIVSTTLGAEGIDVTDGRDIVLADDPAGFAGAVGRLLDDAGAARRIGAAARSLVERRYSWEAAAERLEDFFRAVASRRGR